MDFFNIKESTSKDGTITLTPDFIVGDPEDIMIKGKEFYAIWDEEKGLWSKNPKDVVRIVDGYLNARANELKSGPVKVKVINKTLKSYSSGSWESFCKYAHRSPNTLRQLDNKITFANDIVTKKDYVSKKLPYEKGPGDISAYDQLMSTLYSPEERQKIEWAIGSIIKGDAKKIQKFIVLYGPGGTGKSTILGIIEKLFDGYCADFDAKELTSSNNRFGADAFADNPLVAINHDGNLSEIKDNSKLNSIVSHEEITVELKYGGRFPVRSNCFLFMGTNKPVKITDAKSGLIRRLIDVKPTGRKIPPDIYEQLMERIEFEYGAIADHCEKVYSALGKNYYNNYKPIDMMFKTDPFFNFVEDNYLIFKRDNGVSLKQAYAMYKDYCKESGEEHILQMYKFREELKNYFKNFEDVHVEGDIRTRSYFSGFMTEKFKMQQADKQKSEEVIWLKLDSKVSKLDKLIEDCPAQYATKDDKPISKWSEVKTVLKDIDTSKVHYVKVPENHIVIDFDLKDETGEKSKELNLAAANKFPKTYAEFSKGGSGVHLHYIYSGDTDELSSVYSEGIEIKVFRGNSSLRRRLSFCNNEDIALISSGLPRKEKKVLNFDGVITEKSIRKRIIQNLKKEIWPYTKPSVDFIKKILDDAYESGIHYDVTDMRPDIMAFAANSHNQANACLKLVNEMKFASEDIGRSEDYEEENEIVIFDVEVFPNFFGLCYAVLKNDDPIKDDILRVIDIIKNGDSVQKRDASKELSALLAKIPKVKLYNPTRNMIEELCKHKLVGFNNRRYDNHMLYAWIMGYSNKQLFELSQRIINQSKNAFFGEAYNLSYADIYDFASKKQGLKKWEIELGIHHQEFGYPWDQDLPEDKWVECMDYCENDVDATIATWFACEEDFVARQVLADISGLSINDTTRMHTTKIIFGDEKHPDLVYTDLSKMFPGYKFEFGKSSYRGEDPGEGGYVYAEPGMYTNVALLDIASMHPSSIEALNLFGQYTPRFSDIKNARIFIKHKEFDKAGELLNGAFKPYLKDVSKSKALAQALKIIINSVYGYTTATFDNPFKDPRNVDNIVAKRGALFMIDLKYKVQEKGFTVAHIKTDSIKIPDATPEIIDFVKEYGAKYGYSFEHEATYEKLCLVNDAVYIAKHIDAPWEEDPGKWTATGAQFQVPYVFKTLFSKEPLIFDDFCETKSVTSQLYLDFNEKLKEDEHNYVFVGKVGRFTPVLSGNDGGILYREKDGKYYAATGSKGYRWVESEVLRDNTNWRTIVDESYYIKQVDEAIKAISEYGDAEWFRI